jgi:thiol-disulfide isomerase/thioredoxin
MRRAALIGAFLVFGAMPLLASAAEIMGKFSPLAEPRPVPPVQFVDESERVLNLDAFKGRVVVLNLWATWCVPCREEMPSIGRLKASLAGRPFEVLAVNLAEPEPRIRAFMETVPMQFPVLLDRDMAVAKAWGARVLPATYLVGPDGRIRYSYRGELDWSQVSVRKLVADLLPR